MTKTSHRQHCRARTVWIVLLVLFLNGCAAARWETVSPPAKPVIAQPQVASAQLTLRQMLSGVYQDWQDTPYRYGGNSRSGIDCSAFTQRAINTVYGVTLPRTTQQQLRVGRAVEPGQIRSGDLVFFKTGPQLHHVGVMMDSIKFMHASTSRGVSLSRLDDRYWQERLLEVRRIQ